MPTLHDISNHEDLVRLLTHFYGKLIPDPLIGHFFTEVVDLDLQSHLPRLASFWEQLLFGTGDYQGNPMTVHIHLHKLSPMKPPHFERWLAHFADSVDALFQGPVAEHAKQRAVWIAGVMQAKVAGI